MSRLSSLEPSSVEFNICRTYLEWLTQMPWGFTTIDNENIDEAAVKKCVNSVVLQYR